MEVGGDDLAFGNEPAEVAKFLNFDGGDMTIRGITVLVAGAVYSVAPNGPRSVP